MSSSDPIKSAYELAMERLDAEGGSVKKLTGAQRRELAAIDSELASRIAETHIMEQPAIEHARKAGKMQEASLMEQQMHEKIKKMTDEAEARKDQVRS